MEMKHGSAAPASKQRHQNLRRPLSLAGRKIGNSRLVHLFLPPGFSATDPDKGHEGMALLELDEIKKKKIRDFETK